MISYPMLEWAKDLFPICRSITGQGVRDTLQYFQKINYELTIQSYQTGEKVFDWQIPKEWAITDAYIEHESGQKFAEFKNHNLHILNYAAPIDKILSKDELLPHIYTEPDQPDVIPYITSYYHERWGFCMSDNQKKTLPKGKYRAFIDSELFDGQLNLANAILSGKSQQEIFFSSYICHPSMCNNELSGPVLLNAIMQYIKQHHPNHHYSYHFVLLPETIGSIAYLSRNLAHMQENIICGFNLSCVGDERNYNHIYSRKGDTLSDKALEAAFIGLENAYHYPYLMRGGDERQYCAPGIDLPVSVFCRTKFGLYPEYHTSADNFDVVTQEGLMGAFQIIKQIIDGFELGLYPQIQTLGEPQLGKRNLYPIMSRKGQYNAIATRSNFIAHADGKNSLFDIATLINVSLEELIFEYQILQENNLMAGLHSQI